MPEGKCAQGTRVRGSAMVQPEGQGLSRWPRGHITGGGKGHRCDWRNGGDMLVVHDLQSLKIKVKRWNEFRGYVTVAEFSSREAEDVVRQIQALFALGARPPGGDLIERKSKNAL